jgi:hypothetical protein
MPEASTKPRMIPIPARAPAPASVSQGELLRTDTQTALFLLGFLCLCADHSRPLVPLTAAPTLPSHTMASETAAVSPELPPSAASPTQPAGAPVPAGGNAVPPMPHGLTVQVSPTAPNIGAQLVQAIVCSW